MKILIVHNDYGRYSGEEAVVDRMITDWRSDGHEVKTIRRTSKYSRDKLFGKIHAFFSGIYSVSGRRMMRKELRDFRPDIVNIHNLYPFISPSVLPLCRRAGVPVVMTVHNYRLICPTGLFMRNGKPCEDCLKRGDERYCVKYNCEGSIFRSVAYAMRNKVARITGAYKKNVTCYCCLTEFQKQKLIDAGFDKDKIRVFPNYVESINPIKSSNNHSKYVAYVGRMSYEKGYDLLVEVARRHPEIEFRFAGALREEMCSEHPENVIFCGQLNKKELNEFYSDARFLVIPSRCYEGFPVAMLEMFSYGKPCIAPSHGAFPDLMTEKETGRVCGDLFKPLNIEDLEDKVTKLWNDDVTCEELGKLGRDNFMARFEKSKVTEEWKRFLGEVIV